METQTRYDVTIPEDKPLAPADVKHQIGLIQEIMRDAMKDGEHFGKIPGCGDKPTLLKPGAEKLNLTFRMAPDPEVEVRELPGGHREYQVKCKMTSILTGRFLGAGVGSATTMETKWRYRKAEQKCPECGKETIIKGKKEYGGGWLCYQKKGGCGAKFEDGDPKIENQNMGRIEHDNPADYYNTCLKMAKKRALVDAVLTVTAASDIFTQDIEEMVENESIEKGKESRKPEQSQAGVITEPQRKRFYVIAKKTGATDDAIKEWLLAEYGIEHTRDIPKSTYEEICNRVVDDLSEPGKEG